MTPVLDISGSACNIYYLVPVIIPEKNKIINSQEKLNYFVFDTPNVSSIILYFVKGSLFRPTLGYETLKNGKTKKWFKRVIETKR